MSMSSVDEIVKIKGKVYTKDELLEKCDAYYNEGNSLWHVPIYTANTDFRFYEYAMEMKEAPFIASYKYLDTDLLTEDITYMLEIDTEHKIEVYPLSKDCWKMYNINTKIGTTLPDLTTSIGADDGHYRFILGCTAAFSEIPNVTFSIPFRFEDKEEAVKFIIEHAIYYGKL